MANGIVQLQPAGFKPIPATKNNPKIVPLPPPEISKKSAKKVTEGLQDWRVYLNGSPVRYCAAKITNLNLTSKLELNTGYLSNLTVCVFTGYGPSTCNLVLEGFDSDPRSIEEIDTILKKIRPKFDGVRTRVPDKLVVEHPSVSKYGLKTFAVQSIADAEFDDSRLYVATIGLVAYNAPKPLGDAKKIYQEGKDKVNNPKVVLPGAE